MNNNKNIVHNQKHLTLSDRTFIENRKSIKGKHVVGNCKDCKHWDDCTVRGKERSEPRKR